MTASPECALRAAVPAMRRRWRRHPLLLCTVLVAGVVVLSRSADGLVGYRVFWPVNAVLVAILLLVGRARLTRWFGALVLTSTVTNAVVAMVQDPSRPPWGPSLAYGAITGLCLLITVAALRRDPAWIEGRTEAAASWFRFTVLGVLVPQLLGAALATGWLVVSGALPFEPAAMWPPAAVWLLPNIVSIFVLVPTALRLRPAYLRRHLAPGGVRRLVGLLGLLAAATVAVMLQPNAILLLVLLLPVAVLLFDNGIVGAVACGAVLVPIVVGFSTAGVGPLTAAVGGDPRVGALAAQVFAAMVMAIGYLVAACLHARDTTEHWQHLQQIIVNHADDVVLLIDRRGIIRHAVAPEPRGLEAARLAGTAWRELVHPDDRTTAVPTATSQRHRIRRGDGSWGWCDTRLAPVPDHAARPADLLVVVCRDVTEETEQRARLVQQNRQLAEIVGTDPLTGLPHGARLAAMRAATWAAAATDHLPLSLLVVDIDLFASFNDSYGHRAGDRCLVAMTAAVRAATRGAERFVAARRADEQFLLLLPGADATDAGRIAAALLDDVRARQILHSANPAGVVTVSIGGATADPATEADDGRLDTAADTALAAAKNAGRDRVEIGRRPR